MEEGGVKTEPALSAEAFTLPSQAGDTGTGGQLQEGPDNSNSNEEHSSPNEHSEHSLEHSNANTPIQAHGDASTSSRDRSDDDLVDGVELLLEEKLEIAEFVKANPATARALIRENFTAKFGKQIDLDEIDNIIAMGKSGLREKRETSLLSDLMAFSGFNFQPRWRCANLDPRRGQKRAATPIARA